MSTPAASDLALGSDLVVYAARLVRAVRRELELPAGTRVLSLLDELGPLSITQLAAADRCSQPTMSGAVAQLVEHGLVTKAPNPDDARSSLVSLAQAGRDELTRVRDRSGERVASLIAAHPTLSTEDLATAVAVLREVLTTSSTITTRKGQEGIS